MTASAATFTYHIAGDDSGPWPQILSSIGLTAAAGGPANLVIVRDVAPGSVPQWLQRIDQGEMVVLEGDSELSEALGFEPGKIYELVYTSKDPPIVGLGPAAVRDLIAFLRYDAGTEAAPNPVAVTR